MALFVFGAGATRGSSFVDPKTAPCLPPLDSDFFTQLQRVQSKKHQPLIKDVLEDVVELFGSNFEITMEAVFATLEHTIKMLAVTGENRAFRISDLQQKRDNLLQAVAVVLEESVMMRGGEGKSKRKPRPCINHEKFVSHILSARDAIISFNYDCVLDDALRQYGERKWNAHYGYGFPLGSRGSAIKGDQYWQPSRPATKARTVNFFKLHGSLHFNISDRQGKSTVKLKERPYTRQNGNLKFTVLPPESSKHYDRGVFSKLWELAASAINRSREIVVIGYSLPAADLHSTALLRTSVKDGGLRSLVVVNPDRDARRRIRSALQRGFNKNTRVLSFDSFEHFAAVERSVWGALS